MLSLIVNNPYRLLGVYTNTSQKEQLANISKLKAYARVNRDVQFESDLNMILPKIERSEKILQDSISKISLPSGQLSYAQFWFINKTYKDEWALERLQRGDVDGAIEIWKSEKYSFSALQNLGLCYIIQGNCQKGIDKCFSKLYNNYLNVFVNEVSPLSHATKQSLINEFVSQLYSDGVSMENLYNTVIDKDWENVVCKKFKEPFVELIQREYDKAKLKRKSEPYICLISATFFKNHIEKTITKLQEVLEGKDTEVNLLCDKVADLIIDLAVDYHNNSEEWNKASKCLFLYEYANEIVKGAVVGGRTKKNLDIIKGNIKLEKDPAKSYVSFDFNKFISIANYINLGKTLWSDLEKLGYIPKYSRNSTNLNIDLGIVAWNFNNEHYVKTITLDRFCNLPTYWSDLGIDLNSSYDDICSKLSYIGINYSESYTPQVIEFCGHKCFKGEIYFMSPDKNYKVRFHFEYGNSNNEGFSRYSKNSLDDVWIEYFGVPPAKPTIIAQKSISFSETKTPVLKKNNTTLTIGRSSKSIFNDRCKIVTSNKGVHIKIVGKGFFFLCDNPLNVYNTGSVWIKRPKGTEGYSEIIYTPDNYTEYNIGKIRIRGNMVEYVQAGKRSINSIEI